MVSNPLILLNEVDVLNQFTVNEHYEPTLCIVAVLNLKCRELDKFNDQEKTHFTNLFV